eukprot:jgi/Botrbrau1/18400/Bobra.0469s0002.1
MAASEIISNVEYISHACLSNLQSGGESSSLAHLEDAQTPSAHAVEIVAVPSLDLAEQGQARPVRKPTEPLMATEAAMCKSQEEIHGISVSTTDATARPVSPLGASPSASAELPRKDSNEGFPSKEDRSNGCTGSEEKNLVEALQSLTLHPIAQALEDSTGQTASEEVGLIYDPIMEQHVCQTGDHFECPERTATMVQRFEELGLRERCLRLSPCMASDDTLKLVHSEAHIKQVESGKDYPDPDIYLSNGSIQAARCAVGCCVEAVEAVLSGRCKSSFAVVRPPGHHAECQRAMGFCLYNNTAIAAIVAQQMCKGRVLLLDWDVHHGNGIQDALYDNADIMYISIHRGGGFYPGTGNIKEVGTPSAAGRNVNIPWPRGGFGDADYMAAFDLVIEPIIAEFSPQVILVSAGFDAAEGDYLGGMNLSPAAYAHMTRRLQKLSKDGKIILALEGGYNIEVTASCAAHCVQALLGDPLPALEGRGASRTRRETQSVLQSVVEAQRRYWASALPDNFKEAWEDYTLARKFKGAVNVK